MFSLGNFIGRVTALQHWQTYGTLEGEMESQIQRSFSLIFGVQGEFTSQGWKALDKS